MQRLDQLSSWRFSIITWMELLQGCESQNAISGLKKMMGQRHIEHLPVTPAISDRAVRLLTIHASTTGLRLADALIAATAMEHDHTLLTANIKHFRPIEGLRIERFEMRSQPSVKSVHEDRALYNLETVYRVVELEG
jgi:predicted nucleic acid-binding protein